MKTEQLITLLARQAGPAPQFAALPRLALALVLGLAMSASLAVALIGPVPAVVRAEGAWWVKLGYAAALAAALLWVVARFGRPVPRASRAMGLAATVVLAMAAWGLAESLGSGSGQRLARWLGHSALACPLTVLLLAMPALAAVLWALRGLAPTRPRAAGAAAGLLAGAVGATGYALACNELSYSFVATWYTLGIALAGALGAWAGPRWLRW